MAGWSELLFLANQAFLSVIFVVVAARALRERRRPDIDVALLFGAMAAVLVLPRVAMELGVPAESRQVMVTPLILAVSYLMLRLVADFAAVPWWALRLSEVAFAGQLIALMFQGSVPLAAVAAYAAIPIAWSSVAFLREARRARGVTRRRYAAIAIGNGAAVTSLVVVAIAVPLGAGTIPAAAAVFLQLCVLVAGVSYFLGFATPLWLRRLWRDSELRSFLARAPGLVALPDMDMVVTELAFRARAAMGSDGVLVGLPAGPGVLRFLGTGPAYEAPIDETFGGRAIRAGRALVSLDPAHDVPAAADLYRERDVKMVVAAPIRISDDVIGVLASRSSHASLFAKDDLETCELLADQAALVLKNRALIEERERQAHHDVLTGLPNSGVLTRKLDALIARSDQPRLALILIDPDAFAEVNQTFGHAAGDQLLIEIARRLAVSVPEAGLLARWSGDQFAMLLAGADLARAEGVAVGVVSTFEGPFMAAQEAIECSVSIGIAVYPDHASDARGLVAAADVALAIAKRAAGTYAVYPLEAHPRRARRLALRADLRRAIADGSIRVEYQPLVSLRSGGLLRLEALARWDHPQRGAIPPSEFVELAERTGLIRPLTEQILDKALAEAREWRRWLPRLRVAVNVSARMFADARLIERVATATSRAGCEPEGLSLEITESVLMTEPERARHTITQLRELGVTTEIDDFGTGYSSLAYLQRLPVSGLKIDRQFTAAMTRDERSDAIVRATIRLSHELGFEVVAEGIEDRALWELLAASGCDIGQGFYIARPMSSEHIRPWLGSWMRRVPEAAVPAGLLPSPADRRSRVVLVVDDDPAILSVVRDVLGEHGYAVATASDGEEALGLVLKRTPDAVLLDVHMPLLDGLGFAKAMRGRGIDVPLIMMTAGSNALRWAERAGASGYLAKPFGVDQLLSVTKRVIAGASLAH
jgi:diguanylate cyclase (GGDEF)-like protein